MKKIFLILMAMSLFSCSGSSGSGSNNGSIKGIGGTDSPSGEFSEPPQDNITDQSQKISMIMRWIDLNLVNSKQKFIEGRNQNGFPCMLSLYKDANYYYLSLGTSPNQSIDKSSFTWIGSFIGQSASYRQLRASSSEIHFNITQTEQVGAAEIQMNHSLTLKLDKSGTPINAIGQSTYWPYSACTFR